MAFQFQYGSVESVGANLAMKALSVFQFQYGSVESCYKIGLHCLLW